MNNTKNINQKDLLNEFEENDYEELNQEAYEYDERFDDYLKRKGFTKKDSRKIRRKYFL